MTNILSRAYLSRDLTVAGHDILGDINLSFDRRSSTTLGADVELDDTMAIGHREIDDHDAR